MGAMGIGTARTDEIDTTAATEGAIMLTGDAPHRHLCQPCCARLAEASREGLARPLSRL